MKKILLLLTALFFFGCQQTEKKTEELPPKSKSLIVFYSQTNSTKKLAEIFKEKVSTNLVELQLETPYPSTYDSTIVEVQKERDLKKWPKLKKLEINLSEIDTLYLGYPIMFGTFAPPIYTFLESYDLKQKVIIPFCTYGSGGVSNSREEIKNILQNSTVTLAYGISNKRINGEFGIEKAKKEIADFLTQLHSPKTKEALAGGYSDYRPLSKEDSIIFEKATKDYGYLNLIPLSVSTQIVAGTNYLFICKMKAFGRDEKEVKVKIFNPLPNQGEPEFIVVE